MAIGILPDNGNEPELNAAFCATVLERLNDNAKTIARLELQITAFWGKLDERDKEYRERLGCHDVAIAKLESETDSRSAKGVALWKFWAVLIAAFLTGPVAALIVRSQ